MLVSVPGDMGSVLTKACRLPACYRVWPTTKARTSGQLHTEHCDISATICATSETWSIMD